MEEVDGSAMCQNRWFIFLLCKDNELSYFNCVWMSGVYSLGRNICFLLWMKKSNWLFYRFDRCKNICCWNLTARGQILHIRTSSVCVCHCVCVRFAVWFPPLSLCSSFPDVSLKNTRSGLWLPNQWPFKQAFVDSCQFTVSQSHKPLCLHKPALTQIWSVWGEINGQ